MKEGAWELFIAFLLFAAFITLVLLEAPPEIFN